MNRPALLDRALLALRVQVGERTALLVAADLLLLGQGTLAALLGRGDAADFYLFAVLLPMLALGPPALSELVSLESRAGTLDLTLSFASRISLLALRAAVPTALLCLQGWLVMLFVWWSEDFSFPILGPLLHLLAVAFLIAAASLFWAAHLRTAGSVWVSVLLTLALLGRWVFRGAVPDRLGSVSRAFWPAGDFVWTSVGSVSVLAGAAALLFAYAWRRLRQSSMLS